MKKYRLDTLKRLEDISNGTRVYYETPDGIILLELLMYTRLGRLNDWYVVNEDNSLTFIGYTKESEIELEWI